MIKKQVWGVSLNLHIKLWVGVGVEVRKAHFSVGYKESCNVLTFGENSLTLKSLEKFYKKKKAIEDRGRRREYNPHCGWYSGS